MQLSGATWLRSVTLVCWLLLMLPRFLRYRFDVVVLHFEVAIARSSDFSLVRCMVIVRRPCWLAECSLILMQASARPALLLHIGRAQPYLTAPF